MKVSLPKFTQFPYLRSHLPKMSTCSISKSNFKSSYENLPYDPYVRNKTRQRRYANYQITGSRRARVIKGTDKTIFEQKVEDKRGLPREFELIEDTQDPFLLQFIRLAVRLTEVNHDYPIRDISVDVHQVRQICYPGIQSHNSMEGIHQDGADYIISACVLNRHNIVGGISSIYDTNHLEIAQYLLEEDEFIFQDDRNLSHYVTPINYLLCDSILSRGYRDILGIDITII